MRKYTKENLYNLKRFEKERIEKLNYNDELYFIEVFFQKTVHMEVYSKGSDGYSYKNMHYTYKRLDESLNYPFISWKNLSCCGGFITDEDYLERAVQDGLKLVSGLTYFSDDYSNDTKIQNYIANNQSDDFSLLVNVDKVETYLGIKDRIGINVIRKGKLLDYYNFREIKRMYKKLLPELDEYINVIFRKDNKLYRMFNTDMMELIEKSEYDYVNAKDVSEMIYTGLLLGYPVESTASLLKSY